MGVTSMSAAAAEYKRAYSFNGKMVEGEVLDALDTLFNAWIAQPTPTSRWGFISKDGVIYRGNETGEPVMESDAGAQKAVADELKELLSKTGEGSFQSYLQQKNPGIQIEIRLHDAPAE